MSIFGAAIPEEFTPVGTDYSLVGTDTPLQTGETASFHLWDNSAAFKLSRNSCTGIFMDEHSTHTHREALVACFTQEIQSALIQNT